jgi:hypothetical protein
MVSIGSARTRLSEKARYDAPAKPDASAGNAVAIGSWDQRPNGDPESIAFLCPQNNAAGTIPNGVTHTSAVDD